MKIKAVLIALGVVASILTACTRSDVPQPHRFTVQFSGGHSFDSLRICVDYPRNYYYETVAATPENRFLFEIPDSVFQLYVGVDFEGYYTQNDTVKKVKIMIPVVFKSDTSFSNIQLVFAEQSDITLNLRSREKSPSIFSVYDIVSPDRETLLALEAQYLRWIKRISPKELVDYLADSIKTNPDSRAFMAIYAQYCLNFRFEQNDLIRLYNSFNDRVQNLPIGKLVHRYIESRNILTQKFENFSLPESKTGRMQPLLADTTKYHLIIFSTSWCGPCHAQIPLLKEIYRDLSDRLEIVYISADTPDGADAWRSVMEKEQIPWPSFLPGDRVEEVKNHFCVTSYPTTFLLPPGGVLELIEVRDPAQKEKLYQLVKNE